MDAGAREEKGTDGGGGERVLNYFFGVKQMGSPKFSIVLLFLHGCT